MKVTVQSCLEVISSGASDLAFAKERSSFIVSTILRNARPFAEEYERQRLALVEKYVKKNPEDSTPLTDPARNYVFLSPDAEKKFRESVKELMEVEVDLSAPHLKLADLKFANSEATGTKPRDLYALYPFVSPAEISSLLESEETPSTPEASGLPMPQGLPQ